MTDNHIAALARAYFAGSLAAEEETLLFEALSSSPECMRVFREEEAAWKREHAPSDALLASLSQTKRRWQDRRRTRIRHRIFGLSAAVAAVVAGIFLFRRAGEETLQQPAERHEFVVEAPLSKQSRISLPDGTMVLLNAGSSLRYADDFNKADRAVALTGEAYFEVAKNPDKAFVVTARDCRFTVLGTVFAVSAYEEEEEVRAALLEGSIRFESSPENRLVLVPGELVAFNPSTGGTVKSACDVQQYVSWTQGAIRYADIPFPELLRRLSREYNVDIRLATDRFDDSRIHVSFTREDSIGTILTALREVIPFQKRIENEAIIIY